MSAVRLLPGEHIDSALRRWKKVVQKDGLLVDARKHEHYVPPSAARRRKSLMARKRKDT